MTVANVIDVMTDDQHCNSCALGKAKMPATPTGKTIRPSRKVANSKMYVGYVEEESIYNGFHYYSDSRGLLVLSRVVSEVTDVDGIGENFQ